MILEERQWNTGADTLTGSTDDYFWAIS